MRRCVTLIALVLGLFVTLNAQPAPALKIVVVEGEGGVNIIQQKTAVRPLVEVRDRNNVPVAGASVTFTIAGGGGHAAAFAGGAQTLTVTTNAAGQAAASGLKALSSGAFQIQVQAAYQGQIATAAISQTNFATAAAAQAGASAAGGGGGISGTTIGIVGAAVAGGAVAVSQLSGSADGSNDSRTADHFDSYNGTLSGQINVNSHFTTGAVVSDCVFGRVITGTIRIELAPGAATGRASVAVSQTDVSATAACVVVAQPTTVTLLPENTSVSGGPSALTFAGTPPGGVETYAITFRGALSGNTITGKLTLDISSPPGGNPSRQGSTEMSVTLTR